MIVLGILAGANSGCAGGLYVFLRRATGYIVKSTMRDGVTLGGALPVDDGRYCGVGGFRPDF